MRGYFRKKGFHGRKNFPGQKFYWENGKMEELMIRSCQGGGFLYTINAFSSNLSTTNLYLKINPWLLYKIKVWKDLSSKEMVKRFQKMYIFSFPYVHSDLGCWYIISKVNIRKEENILCIILPRVGISCKAWIG